MNLEYISNLQNYINTIKKNNDWPDKTITVDNLHQGLEYIVFPKNYNLPIGLKGIFIGKEFNQTLDYLPTSIIQIFIHKNYKLNLNNIPSDTVIEFYYK